MSYASFLRSSDVRALGDDARKDDENVGFLSALSLFEQAEWLARCRWVRVADRLAENEGMGMGGERFSVFCAQWRDLVERGQVPVDDDMPWREIRSTWWSPSGDLRAPLEVVAFDGYLEALSDYTKPGVTIPTLAEHDRMLLRLSGNFFRIFPYLADAQREAAARFGMLDQLMNNLRDLAEDAAHGLCFFPADVLARFDVPAQSVIDGTAVDLEGYRAMMHFWLGEHLASVRAGAGAFLALGDLHPSLVAMRRASLARYDRIERIFRACQLDYLAFPQAYWGRPHGASRVA